MAAYAEERIRNELGSDSGSITYLVRDDAGGNVSADDAIAAAVAVAPSTFDGLPAKDAKAQELFTNIWDVTILYSLGDPPGKRPQPDTGDVDYEFDVGLESIHIQQSLATVSAYIAPDLTSAGIAGPPDFGGAINVTADLKVEGTDILVPTARFTLRYRAPNANVTDVYQKTVEGLVGTVNDATFRGRDAGTLLLAGVTGSRHNAEAWNLAFQFSYRPNVDVTIGDIENVQAKGWEHIWVMYLPKKDEDAQQVIKKPAYAYVEQIYREGDFGDLALPS